MTVDKKIIQAFLIKTLSSKVLVKKSSKKRNFKKKSGQRDPIIIWDKQIFPNPLKLYEIKLKIEKLIDEIIILIKYLFKKKIE